MSTTKAFIVGSCPHCSGRGVLRHNKHFFYGICLVAAGVLCFFEWPPTPGIFQAIKAATTQFHLPAWVGPTLIWGLTGVPPLFGLAFLYAWIERDTCPACQGHGKISREAPEPA